MSKLLDLPPELLVLITTHLLPHSPIPFALTCRTIFQCSKPTIALHNTYISTWRHVSCGTGDTDVLHVLDSIARDPLVAVYVEVLHLRHMRDNSSFRQGHRDLSHGPDTMTTISDMVIECPFLEEADIDGSWWWDLHLSPENSLSDAKTERPMATLITLFLFLPNLKELGLPRWWSIGEWELWDDPSLRNQVKWMPFALLTKMIQLARKPELSSLEPKPGYRPLGKLETITPYASEGYDSRVALQQLEPLLALPNLENVYSISGMACFDDYTGPPFHWHTSHLKYNLSGFISLRRLEIAYGCCDAEGISAIVSNTPRLEVFKYSHQVKWHGCEMDWQAGLFVSALSREVGKTLKQLVIRAESACECYGKPSFASFQKLEELEIDDVVLCGREDGEHGLEDGEQGKLRDLLPRSIKKVLLNLGEKDALHKSYVDWFSFVGGFGEVWKERFPELGNIVVRVKKPEENGGRVDENEDVCKDFEAARRLCEVEGLKWKVLSKQKFGLMGWERQFCERFEVTS